MERTVDNSGWLWAPSRDAVRRAVWVGVVWAYVGAVAAGLLLALAVGVALAANGIIYLADYGSRTFLLSDVVAPVRVVFWLVVPAAFGIAIWSAAYVSTSRQSWMRGLAGLVAGGVVALLFHLTGLSGALLAGLGLGWAVALPAEHPARWAVRAVLPVLLGAVVLPAWNGLGLPVVILILLLSPSLSALFVWLSDIAYAGLVAGRREGGATPARRARSSVD